MRPTTMIEIAHILNSSSPHSFSSSPIAGFCVDSRSLKPGEIFFALKGDQVDGHQYLQEVQHKGAIGAVVSKDYRGEVKGLSLLRVEDPLQALQQLAKIMLSQSSSRVVAITGSLGKTTTKEFTKTLLTARYHVSASPGNSNSQIGLPLAILNHTTGNEDIIILEMGMTCSNQIAQLVQIAPPEVAVITLVTLVHACNFHSLSDIAQAKGEIFSHPSTRLGIIPRELTDFEEIKKIGACKKITFSSSSSHADYSLNSSLVPSLENDFSFQSKFDSAPISLGKLSIPGQHNRHNLLAAIAVARYFDIDWDTIKNEVSSLTLPEKRLSFVRHRNILFLNDSYNAAEMSVKAALQTLPQPEGDGRKIAVLGGMAELGKFSEGCHQRVGEFALDHVERVYCLGEECLPIYEIWKKMNRPIQLFHHRRDLIACLKNDLKPKDVVLLKGSRNKELWKIIEELD